MNRLTAGVQDKLAQWDQSAAINACRAIQSCRDAVLVTYPTGKQMMRFAEPFADFGMHYEVAPEVWEQLLIDPHVYV